MKLREYFNQNTKINKGQHWQVNRWYRMTTRYVYIPTSSVLGTDLPPS